MQSIKVKVLTMFMSLVMAVTMFPALNSNADTIKSWKENGITCKLNETTGVMTLTGNGALPDYKAIDKTGNGKPDQTSAPWGERSYYVRKLIVGDGITRIGDNAFLKCSYLESVEFQSKGSLTTIGTQAFYDCYKIKTLAFPSGLTGIGRNAFAWCYGVTTVSFPMSLQTIAYGAFAYCESLTKVYIPKNVSSIGDFAFKDNWKLTSVTGGAGLKTIGRQAFEYSSRLKTFKITSKKLSKIGSCAFYCCNSLKTIYIKKTTKLTKKKVKGSLYFSSVKTVKVKKSKVKKYKKYFTYRNCGKRYVKVKK